MPTGQEVGVVARQNQEVRPTFVTLVAKQLALPGFQVCSGGQALEALDEGCGLHDNLNWPTDCIFKLCSDQF